LEVLARSITLVFGIGNLFGCDDGVGLAVAQYLKKKVPNDVRVTEKYGDCTSLLDAWKGAATVILIDAIFSGAIPGTVYRFYPNVQPIPVRFLHHSTHAISIGETIELARATNRLPACLVVYGIEGKHFHTGIGLTTEVEAAVCKVGDSVLQDARLGFQVDKAPKPFEILF
jgi:hydrogenase maturation protease